MLPEAFIKRIHTQKYIDAEALLKAFTEPSPVSIRINTGKWKKFPLGGKPVPWCSTGYYLDTRPSYTLDPLFHSGCYYPQEASGMFLEQVLKQTVGSIENIRALDLCGAPGGKSALLSDFIGPGSLLISNDVIRSRAQILSETISKWGAGNTIVTQNDPSVFGKLKGYFDIILVDAPCSGEGMFRTDVAVSEWSLENTDHCSERQKRILKDIWPALKEDGILLYSTCTFNNAENEENIKWLTGNNEAECIRLDISNFAGIKEIDYQGIYGYGFHPGRIEGEGFFVSVIRKKAREEKLKTKNLKKQSLIPEKEDIAIVREWTGFTGDRLMKWNDEVFSVPCSLEEYLFLFNNLRIIKGGTKIFAIKNKDYLPAHELALSQQLKKNSFPCKELDISTALAYLRRDNLTIHDLQKGWNIVTYQGANAGYIKNLGSRINNYFPVEWRIRMTLPEPGTKNIIEWRQ